MYYCICSIMYVDCFPGKANGQGVEFEFSRDGGCRGRTGEASRRHAAALHIHRPLDLTHLEANKNKDIMVGRG